MIQHPMKPAMVDLTFSCVPACYKSFQTESVTTLSDKIVMVNKPMPMDERDSTKKLIGIRYDNLKGMQQTAHHTAYQKTEIRQ